MNLSLNQRAHELADRLAADAGALRVAVSTLPGGTRVVDCGSDVPGGLEAGRRFAEITMGGLGSVGFAPLVLDGRWMPGATVVTDHPALACLGSQYAGWKLDRDGYFAMASGPGRALIRAEELFDDLEVDERASTAVLCLETGDEPPDALAEYVAGRAGVAPGDLTLLFAPTASLAGGVQIAGRIVETALHKLHELDFDVGRVVSGFGTCPLPPVARTDPDAIGRTNDAILYGGQVELTIDGPGDELEALVERMPSSASDDHGRPFGEVLKAADWDFYAIDPMLFSPAEVSLVSVESGRSFQAGGVRLDVLEQSFPGMIVETVTTTLNPDGTVNCAAMGVEWGDEEIVIKPYRSTRTLRNLEARGAAVVNLTDDILLFTQAALEDPHPPTRPAAVVDGAVLADACSWREVTVEAIDATGARARVATRVVGRGAGREFIGFNRASHAVLEASILASRTGRLPADEIRAELARLAVVADKTAGPRERAAMDCVLAHVHSAIGGG